MGVATNSKGFSTTSYKLEIEPLSEIEGALGLTGEAYVE